MQALTQIHKSAQKTKSANSTTPKRVVARPSDKASPPCHLQQDIGDHDALGGAKDNGSACGNSSITGTSFRFAHDFSRTPVYSSASTGIQPKLKVNTPRDKYEQEADRVADMVMLTPAPRVQRAPAYDKTRPLYQDSACRHERHLMQLKESDTKEMAAPPIVSETLNQPGHPLDKPTKALMGRRLGTDLDQVRIHTNQKAAMSAKAVNARVFTVGHNIVFGEGQYAPGTREGQRLLAHELVHTIQQASNPGMLQRISYDNCTSTQETIVRDSHNRAIEMLDNAIAKLGTYNGTTPADVKTALNRHFHSSSSGFGGWIRFNLKYLRLFVDLPQYECQSTQSIPNPAWTMWCVPFTDIELYPNWFTSSPDYRAALMIHEWVHHYGCNFDLGYISSPGYSGHSTTRALLNADPWQWFVYDIR